MSEAEQLRELMREAEALRDALRARRESSPYPWDPTPITDYNRLLERARTLLPAPPVELPEPRLPSSGRPLWRTPTDEALEAVENLRAAIATALEADA